MNKEEFKKLLIFTIPMSMIIGGLIGGLLGTRSALSDAEERLSAAETLLVKMETELEVKEELNSDLMENLFEARNQLFMIDMYNEREFYMNEKGE